MCKTTLDGSNDPLVGALNVSVLFMMAMPYAILGTVGGWIYFSSRRPSGTAPSEPEPEPDEATLAPELREPIS